MFSLKGSFPLLRAFGFVGLLAGSAWGQTPDSAPSAVVAQPQAASTQSDSIDQQIGAWTRTPALAADALTPGGDAAGPRQIHGEAGVAFGSGGYRAGYLSTDIPIGANSDLGLAVGESEFKPKHFGTVRNQSLAISLSIGADGGASQPINCASPTAAMDGRYLEPMWVSHMRGEALARDQADCGGPTFGAPPAPAPGRAAE